MPDDIISDEAADRDAKLPLCRGCRNDFYNQPDNSQTGRCWLLEKAQVVTKFRIGWCTPPTNSDAYRKVITLSCHNASGLYAQHDSMPYRFPGLSRVMNEEPLDARKGV